MLGDDEVVESLGDAEIGDAGRGEKVFQGFELGFAAVDKDEVGVNPLFVAEAAGEGLVEVLEIVVFLTTHFELAIFRTVGDAVYKNDHAGDDVLSLIMGDVVAFDASRGMFEI